MPDFSVIANDPVIRAIVQEGTLERAFHDALFPRLLFRGEAAPVLFPGNIGDTMFFSRPGLIKKSTKPLPPGTDPTPKKYEIEQWGTTMQQYGDSIDTYMPNSAVAIANLFLRNGQQIGLNAGQSLNANVRDRLFQAGLAGNAYADGAAVATTALRVSYLAGFTTARSQSANGSPVRFAAVSTQNPLPILIGSGPAQERNVIGFVPDVAGDEVGPGILTLDAAVTCADRDPVLSVDRAIVLRAGGALTTDGVASTSLFDLDIVRESIARLRFQNVPEQADGWFHCHVDPTSESQVYGTTEFQRLMTSLPDYYVYARFAIGTMLGTMFIRNTESPFVSTVGDGSGDYSTDDPIPGDLRVTAGANDGTPVHRPIFIGQGAMYEYYLELSQLLTDAGVTGKIGEPTITNNGIEVFTDRVRLLIRSPLDRLQQLVSTTWQFIGDWPVGTDATSGDKARYKRVLVVEHGGTV
jgi:hypothetical protein